jgi:hypothetical protein
MNLWIYADETSFMRPAAATETAGYGVLLTTAPIGAVVVNDALAALDADSDRHNPKTKKQDDATLANMYFHGTDDSGNAHSHFCTSIRKHVTGHFTYIFEDPTSGKAASLKQLYAQALRLALVELCYWPGPIELLIEQRDSLTAGAAEDLILDLYRDMATRVFDAPHDPFYCPKVEVQVGSKADAPLQVVDFLLWSCARAHSKVAEDLWLTRSDPTIRFEVRQGSGPVFEGSLHLGPNPLAAVHPDYPPATHWMTEPPHAATGWPEIEQAVAHWLTNSPAEVQHLKPILQQAAAALASTDSQDAPDHVKAIATAYLCLFDTVPLWKDAKTHPQWTRLAALRQAAAAVAKMEHSTIGVQMFVNDAVRFRRTAINERRKIAI